MKIGKIRDAHGMKGEVFVISFPKDLTWLGTLTHLKLEGAMANGAGKHEVTELTFPIIGFKAHKKGALVRLEGVTDRTMAEKLIGFTIDMDPSELKSSKGEKIFLHEVEGFEVSNQDSIRGVISGFASNGAQDLAVIKAGANEFPVPFIPEFITEILWSEKKIVMTYPLELEDIK